MTVVCTLVVTVCMADCSFGIESRTEAEGKIITTGQTKYLVDFSKSAKDGDWMGDYSKKLVQKDDCVKAE
jgi:hypothetical protein